jgi:glycosyltransferase involved in cell wall biosynthesis
MFCSTIIATVARPSLSRTVQSLLNQGLPPESYEIIVVNDSGHSLNNETWHSANTVRIISTNQQEKSIARNTGAAAARGEFLHFLDDDDFMLPGGLEVLRELSKNNNAVLFYGGSTLTDRKGKMLLNLVPNLPGNCFIQLIAGEWIPLGSYIVHAQTFFEAGGFNPQMTMGEDSDLTRRIALLGDFSGISTLVLQAEVGEKGSTADYRQLPTQSRAAREMILDHPKAYPRMITSATNSFWYGRIVRAYLTSTLWNLQRRKIFIAATRAFFALRACFASGMHLNTADFWRAIRKPYHSSAFSISVE